jgi:hypothetical protein
MSDKEQLGYYERPDRYSKKGRETIDRMRDLVSDEAFVAFCRLTALKYRDRGDEEKPGSIKKAEWYEAMAQHVETPQLFPDPRSHRDAFLPYERMVPEGMRPVKRTRKGATKQVGLFGYFKSVSEDSFNVYVEYGRGVVGFYMWIVSHSYRVAHIYNSRDLVWLAESIKKLRGEYTEQMEVLALSDRRIPLKGSIGFITPEIIFFEEGDIIEGALPVGVDYLDAVRAQHRRKV